MFMTVKIKKAALCGAAILALLAAVLFSRQLSKPAMSYPIDVYRGDTEAQKNPITFGTYISLFPQLIAGPIVRYKDVAEQLSDRTHSVEKFSSGVCRFTVGLGKKVLIANNIGALWDVYAAKGASELTVLGSWLGIIAFTLQIYFDFSGYSDMTWDSERPMLRAASHWPLSTAPMPARMISET